MCKRPKHAEFRPDYLELKKVVDKYLGKILPNIPESTLCIFSNFMFQTHGAGKHSTWRNTKVNLEKFPQVQSINTRTGSTSKNEKFKVIQAIMEHSFYIMQTIRIGSTDALVFFYRGSNTYIIKGSIPVEEGLQCISAKPTALSVVGGSKVRREYGMYLFNLGPTENSEYHEMT